jgi:hypothetical protein
VLLRTLVKIPQNVLLETMRWTVLVHRDSEDPEEHLASKLKLDVQPTVNVVQNLLALTETVSTPAKPILVD